MSNLQKRLSTLSPEKLALILKKLKKNKQDRPAQPSRSATAKARERQILPVPRTEPIPLSFAQQRLWFLDQLEGGGASYNMPAALRLDGRLNLMALRRSLNEIVRRHEVLRTTFPMRDGVAVQQIAPLAPIGVPIVDLSSWTEAQQEAEVERLAIEEQGRLFDLANGPLLCLSLLRLGAQSHILLLNMHHIVSDGWSVGVFIQELSVLYEAYAKGKRSPLPDLAIQYADFAQWQRQWLSGERLNQQLEYWKQQLAAAPALLQLPTDYPRPPMQRFRGGTYAFSLPKKLSDDLNALSKRFGVTSFMMLQAAFATLLYRYCGQEDILVGTPIANRNRREIEPLIGFFVNTLVLRTSFQDNPTFQELLKRVQTAALDAYKHQDLPFELLVETLRPERTLSYNPLFQVMFALENVPTEDLSLGGLKLTLLDIEILTAKFDLSLLMVENEAGFSGSWEYNRDLFDLETIQRMAGHFETLLRGIVANPVERVEYLSLLTDVQRHQLLVEWNQTQTDYGRDRAIHDLFEEQVERTPDAVALIMASLDHVGATSRRFLSLDPTQLTYRELNERANQLAHELIGMGVGPETFVGLCVERSLEMVVGMLAILKAGGAYVPLDPTYPAERLSFMLEDTQVPVLLTQEKWRPHLPAGVPIVSLEPSPPNPLSLGERGSLVGPPHAAEGERLAYVMYTSGSTGKPKGVSIPHRGVVRLVKNTNYMSLTEDEVFLQLAPISFDASTLEIWGPLLNGGRLVIMPPHTPSLEELGQVIREYQITSLWLTAGLFHLMVDERLHDLSPLRQLLAGGDVLSVPHVQKVLQELPDCQLINGYGPTESTTFTCCFPIRDASDIRASVPIGRPIANTQIYILDQHQQPVPIGVPGELYIGGDGLARHYHNRPQLSKEKFIPNPFADGNLYRTGDLARYLPDGNVEFIGRFDHQVKIRGFRIELGEIETVLNDHPAVREVVVVAQQDDHSGKRLVAYIVPESSTLPSVGKNENQKSKIENPKFKRYLSEKLPDYMIPDVFMVLETLPLNPNGKVDRRALPAPDKTDRSAFEKGLVAPRTLTEQQLVAIWRDLLGVSELGIHDDFFELGGHSLLATQLVSRVRETFQLALPLHHLFELATIAELAELIDTLKEEPVMSDDEEEEEGEI